MLKLGHQLNKKQKQHISITSHITPCLPFIDLHGKHVDEALEMLDDYISRCLIVGYDEVIIKHGIGSGILAKVVKEFLDGHKNVKSFTDAPPQNGGFGAKIVRL